MHSYALEVHRYSETGWNASQYSNDQRLWRQQTQNNTGSEKNVTVVTLSLKFTFSSG
jgi:hypothetical protein